MILCFYNPSDSADLYTSLTSLNDLILIDFIGGPG